MFPSLTFRDVLETWTSGFRCVEVSPSKSDGGTVPPHRWGRSERGIAEIQEQRPGGSSKVLPVRRPLLDRVNALLNFRKSRPIEFPDRRPIGIDLTRAGRIVCEARGMAHFYLSTDLERAATGDTIAISGAEARHAVTVSRVREGDRLRVGNGAGLIVEGVVASAASDLLELAIENVELAPAMAPAVWLAQALAKGGRDEAAVQAATELGVDGVIPWAAERSIVKWDGARAKKGHERWSAIVHEATKQSVRPWLPEVSSIVSTAQLTRLAETTRMLVLDPGADAAIGSVTPDRRDLVIVVGPEGGITPKEIDRLAASGATPVRLGSGTLRTSTAGPAAIAVLSVTLRRW